MTNYKKLSFPPTVFWFTGLSGSGKTTLSSLFYSFLKKKIKNIILLDGDNLRVILSNNHDFSREGRLKLAFQYAGICKLLNDQGLYVICATVSMFHEVREWNRLNISSYKEIFIKVPMDILIQRDKKKIYKDAISGKIHSVVGMDIKAEEPENPDLIIENTGNETPKEIVKKIINHFIKFLK